jgi:hypothetical protein
MNEIYQAVFRDSQEAMKNICTTLIQGWPLNLARLYYAILLTWVIERCRKQPIPSADPTFRASYYFLYKRVKTRYIAPFNYYAQFYGMAALYYLFDLFTSDYAYFNELFGSRYNAYLHNYDPCFIEWYADDGFVLTYL